MINISGASIGDERFLDFIREELLRARVPGLRVTVERGEGEVGGGALPLQRLPGWVVALEHPERSVDELDRWARAADPPVIGYIRTGKFRMDVRTLSQNDIVEAAEALGRSRLGAGPERPVPASRTRGSRPER
jgi:L-seryl-tRNA(Ser) seleniumtransferase